MLSDLIKGIAIYYSCTLTVTIIINLQAARDTSVTVSRDPDDNFWETVPTHLIQTAIKQSTDTSENSATAEKDKEEEKEISDEEELETADEEDSSDEKSSDDDSADEQSRDDESNDEDISDIDK